MKIKALLLATAAIATLATSCKKDDNKPASSSPSLASGTSQISFNTDIPYNGKTAHEYKHSVPGYVSQCKRQAAGNAEVLMLDGGGTSNLTKVTNNMIRFNVAKDATTANGTIKQSITSRDPGEPEISFSESEVSGSSVEAMTMSEGTVEITKLSATEIEGTFSGTAVNEDAGKTYKITNGKFLGKF